MEKVVIINSHSEGIQQQKKKALFEYGCNNNHRKVEVGGAKQCRKKTTPLEDPEVTNIFIDYR